MPSIKPGLYAITNFAGVTAHKLEAQTELALKGGIQVLQYRDKSDDRRLRQEQANRLLQLCRKYAVPLIINDDIELAAAIGADGVHLGKDDPLIAEARSALGERAIIGVSCYDRIDRALEAQDRGANYVAFGRFFPSSSKPKASHAAIETLHLARDSLSIPIVAIGGITPENGASLIEAGATNLAVIHGVFGQPDIPVACRRFRRLFELYDKES